MNVFDERESGLLRQICCAATDSARQLRGTARFLLMLLLTATGTVILPSTSIAQDGDASSVDRAAVAEIDWELVKSTLPADWSTALKDQLTAAGFDLQLLAERVRLGQQSADQGVGGADHDGIRARLEQIGRDLRAAIERGEISAEDARARYEAAREHLAGAVAEHDEEAQRKRRIIAAAMDQPPEEWSDRLQEAIVSAGWNLEEFTKGVRQRQAYEQIGRDLRAAVERGEISAEDARARFEAARERLGTATEEDEEAQRRSRIVGAAMDTPVEDWSDRLKEAIEAEGWDLEEFSAGIRLRQAHQAERTQDVKEQLRELQRGLIARAMALPVADWTDELKAWIQRAQLDVEVLADRIGERQAAGTVDGGVAELIESSSVQTAVEWRSWGEIKAEAVQR
mgnify:CR=1 FL=1|jgi:hypothetical protein